MREFLVGALSVATLGSTLGFLVQRPAAKPSPGVQTTAEYVPLSRRYEIYDPSGQLPMLLDTKTGRTWYRQFAKDSAGNSTGLIWTPARITPADTSKNWYDPGNADLPL